jgi:hypothetical protein
VKHFAGKKFWKSFEKLSDEIKELAKQSFKLLKRNPNHPSLHFKKIDTYWTVRVGITHRAIGVQVDKGVFWFWIGHHKEYDRLLTML